MIYPAIDLIDGKVVRLTKGDFDQKTTYNEDPVAVAKEFQALGSEFLHVVDLDGAKEGKPKQAGVIEKIVKNTDLKVQVGGGIRDKQAGRTYLDLGVDRIIIGSVAVKNREEAADMFESFSGERITLGLDVVIGDDKLPYMATSGWQKISDQTADQILDFYRPKGLKYILCTDIAKDGMMKGPNVELYKYLATKYPDLSFLASGGVSSIEDLRAVKNAGVKGAIIGKALYEGKISLGEALQC